MFRYLNLPDAVTESSHFLDACVPRWRDETRFVTTLQRWPLYWLAQIEHLLGESAYTSRLISEGPESGDYAARIHRDGDDTTFAINVPVAGTGELLLFDRKADGELTLRFKRHNGTGGSWYASHVAPFSMDRDAVPDDEEIKLWFQKIGEYTRDWQPTTVIKLDKPVILNVQTWHAGRNLEPENRVTLSFIFKKLSFDTAIDKLLEAGMLFEKGHDPKQ